MIRYLIILIIFAVILSACNPYHFELNKYNRNKYRSIVENLSRYGAVEKYADNGFLIHKDASAAIKTPKVMQSLSDMTLRYKKDATGVFRVLFRATAKDISTDKYVEMKVDYHNSTINFKDTESGFEHRVPVDIDLELGNRLFAINDGKYLKIYWDCDEIYNYKTNIPSSEYIIIRTEENCSLEIEGWEVSYLYEDAKYIGIPMRNIFLE